MENRAKIRGDIIASIISLFIILSIPSFALGDEAASSSSDQTVQSSDTSDSSSHPASEAKDGKGQIELEETDTSTVDPAEETADIQSTSDKTSEMGDTEKAKKKGKPEEEPEAIEPEAETMGMSMAMGGSGEGAEDGVYSAPVAVSTIYTGAATYEIPIIVPPGRNGMQPNISMIYNSYRSNGWIGVGWDIDLGSIRRSTKRGLDYTADDYVFSRNGSLAELVPRNDWDPNYYSAKIEGAFSKYYYNPTTGGWEVTAKDGTRYFYGSGTDNRQTNTHGTFMWCLDRVEDTNGNYMEITYFKDEDQIYPDTITYTKPVGSSYHKTVKFVLEDRPDDQVSYVSGALVKTAKRLSRIDIHINSGSALVRRYLLEYDDEGTVSGRSRLSSVKIKGSDDTSTLPPITFDWLDGGDGTFDTSYASYINELPGALTFGDINGDGSTDFAKYFGMTKPGGGDPTTYIYPFLSNGDGTFSDYSLIEAGTASSSASVQLGDVDGDALSDIVSKSGSNSVQTYLSNGNGTFAGPTTTALSASSFDSILLADINGDGYADFIGHNHTSGNVYAAESNGDGTFNTSYSTHTGSGGAGAGLVKAADVNGDGYADLLKLTSTGTIYVYLADGNGNFSSASSSTVAGSGGSQPDYINLADVNGDGLADIIKNDANGYIYVSLSKGDGTFTSQITTTGVSAITRAADVNGDGMADVVQNVSGTNNFFLSKGDGTFASPIYASGPGGEGALYTADINGDGMADLLKNSVGCVCASLANGIAPTDRVMTIQNKLDGIISIVYEKSTEYENTLLPFIIYPVSSVETDDGNNGIAETLYSYSGGLYDFANRDFRGFGYVQKINPDELVQETWYLQGEFTKGRIEEIRVREPGSQTWFKDTIYAWDSYPIPDTDAEFIKLSHKYTELKDSETVYTQEDYTYDNSNGNLLTTTVSGTEAESVVKTNQYVNKDSWTWRLSQETIQGNTSGLVRETYYGYESGTGNLVYKEYRLDGEANPHESMGYDEYGNRTSFTDAMYNTTTTTYDANTSTYPVTVSYPATNGISHVEQMTHDHRFGRVNWSRDENANETDYFYDEFGRLERVDYPDGGQVLYNYFDDVFPRYTKKSVKEAASSYIHTYRYFDGFGRQIQTVTYGENGKLIVTRDYYDDMGRNFRTEGPYFDTGDPRYPIAHPSQYPFTETTFDYRGRPTRIEQPDGSGGTLRDRFTLFDYAGFKTTVTDPDNKQKTETKDYLGRIVKVTEHTSGGNFETTYDYNAAGDLLEVEDHLGNTTTIVYDTLGRKTGMTDPDMGAWYYEYDSNGNLVAQTDAKGQIIEFEYDELNRVTFKDYFNTPDPDVTYAYDSGIKGKGRLYSVTNGSVTTVYDSYDAMGRITKKTKSITGDQARETEYEYDLAGKSTKTTYPDDYYVTNAYHGGTGFLHTVTGSDSTVFAAITDYEPTGKMGKIVHENGAQTLYTYDAYSTRLLSIVTKDAGNEEIQDRGYEYSARGNITEIIDGSGAEPVTYTYDYDDLHRLTRETNTGSYDSVSISYNAIGNITSKSFGSNTLSFSYDSAHKHAVDYITFNSQDYEYSYDANGNMTQGPNFTMAGPDGARNVLYNADNMPLEISLTGGSSSGVTTALLYDGDSSRAKKIIETESGTTTFYYIGDHFEVKAGVETKYIFAGNLRVAQIEGAELSFFHKDHLGSSTVMTNANGYEIEWTNYLPFGGQRDHSGTEKSNYKFTDQELDPENGLYNYGARMYDPIIGRFITPDSMVPEPFNPQSFNRFSYCLNNPMIYTDPTGHFGMGFAYGWSSGAANCGWGDFSSYAYSADAYGSGGGGNSSVPDLSPWGFPVYAQYVPPPQNYSPPNGTGTEANNSGMGNNISNAGIGSGEGEVTSRNDVDVVVEGSKNDNVLAENKSVKSNIDMIDSIDFLNGKTVHPITAETLDEWHATPKIDVEKAMEVAPNVSKDVADAVFNNPVSEAVTDGTVPGQPKTGQFWIDIPWDIFTMMRQIYNNAFNSSPND